MDPLLQNILVQIGTNSPLVAFMYLRLKRADEQVDKANHENKNLSQILVNLSTASTAAITKFETLLSMREGK